MDRLQEILEMTPNLKVKDAHGHTEPKFTFYYETGGKQMTLGYDLIYNDPHMPPAEISKQLKGILHD